MSTWYTNSTLTSRLSAGCQLSVPAAAASSPAEHSGVCARQHRLHALRTRWVDCTLHPPSVTLPTSPSHCKNCPSRQGMPVHSGDALLLQRNSSLWSNVMHSHQDLPIQGRAFDIVSKLPFGYQPFSIQQSPLAPGSSKYRIMFLHLWPVPTGRRVQHAAPVHMCQLVLLRLLLLLFYSWYALRCMASLQLCSVAFLSLLGYCGSSVNEGSCSTDSPEQTVWFQMEIPLPAWTMGKCP